jgi:nitrilase
LEAGYFSYLQGNCAAGCYARRGGMSPDAALGDDPDTVLMRGGSMIVAPLGQVLAGPDYSGETILYADIDPAEVVRGKYDFDVAGHYARPDVFSLSVNVARQRAVKREGAE